MLHQLRARLNCMTRRVVSALTLAFLFSSSSVVQAQTPSEPSSIPCGTLCIIIIIFIVIVLILVILRFIRKKKG